ncbi:hypothetical protein [Bombilactobacillus mellis]|uniref:hypothetical protein n=1 Tax=Bombilactobacillus mellis TaxID=1218508 RepID=UPI001436E07E|nr:hypothetical protein [Bombilactobacillus mellis]NUF26337.1 hypothetical protein [Bombilactobacillus mellis]QHJ83642.1 MAG: hypothetical protein [Caudoviricetes sp.]
MRLTNFVKFYKEENSSYNPDTGQYDDSNQLIAVLPANVTDLGADRTKELFGNLDTDMKVIRTFQPVNFNWSYCLIDNTKFSQTKILSHKSLIVGERHD